MTVNNHPDSGSKLGRLEKFSYGIADLGFNFYWANIATFLLIFYTDVFGIGAAAAGTMLLVIKVVNAFTDPMFGAWADRTRTKFGKFRPYLVWMAVPLAAAGVLTYTTPNLGEGGKLLYAYGTYLLMMVCYTGINIPYNALSGVITSDSQERVTINSLRFIFAYTGSTVVTAATPSLVRWLGSGNERLGWQLTMVFWGVAASCVFLVTFFNTRERIAPSPTQKTNVRQDVRDLTNNRPWIVLFFLALIIMMTITLRNSSAAYYFKYYVERPSLLAVFVPLYMGAAAAGAALTPVLTRFLDKKLLLMLLMGATGTLSVAFYFIPKHQIAWMFVLQVLIGLVLGPKSPLSWSMLADAADYNEWRVARRATGMTFSAATFSQKLGTALATALIGWVLAAMGYVPNAAQPPQSKSAIVMMMSLIPAFFAFLAVAVMVFYNLDNKQMALIQKELAERKAGESQTAVA